ncbi:MAG: hypothetical protein R2852_01170 [Bacteroidia bacterium]
MSIPDIDFADPKVFNPVGFEKYNNENMAVAPQIKVNKSYNPFGDAPFKSVQNKQWQQLFGNSYLDEDSSISNLNLQQEIEIEKTNFKIEHAFQLPNGFIVTEYKNHLLIVDQRAAHERILYEKYLNNIKKRAAPIQQLLFPRTIELSKQDYALAHEIMNELKDIGFDVADFGKECLIINGVPAETAKGSEKDLLEGIIEYFKHNADQFAGDKRKTLAVALAQNEAIFRTKTMEQEELISLLNQLCLCAIISIQTKWKTHLY